MVSYGERVQVEMVAEINLGFVDGKRRRVRVIYTSENDENSVQYWALVSSVHIIRAFADCRR
jgi:hypothetical protein